MFPIVSPELHRQMFDSLYCIVAANPFVTCEAPPQPPCCCQSLPLFPGNALQSPQPQIRQGCCPSTPNIYNALRLPSAPQCLPWNPLCQPAQNQSIFLEQPYQIKLPLNVCSAELTLQVDPGAAKTTAAATPRQTASQSQTERKSAPVTGTQTKAADGTEAKQTQANAQQQQGQNRHNEKMDKASEADFCCLCCDQGDEAEQSEAQNHQTEGSDGRLVTRSEDRRPIDTRPCKQGICSKSGGQLECEECGCSTQPGGDQQRNDAVREERMREMRRSARERHMKQCSHANKNQPAADNNFDTNSNQPRQQTQARSAGSTCEVTHLANEIVTNVLSEAAKTVSDQKPTKSILRRGKRKITIRTFEPRTISEQEHSHDPMQYGKAKELDAKGDEETKDEGDKAARVEDRETQLATKEKEIGEANVEQKKDNLDIWGQPQQAEKEQPQSKAEVPQTDSESKSKKRKRPPSPEPIRSQKEASLVKEKRPTTNDKDLKIKRIMQKQEMLARAEEEERIRMLAEKTNRRRLSLIDSHNAEIERQKQAQAESTKPEPKAEEENLSKTEPNEVPRQERRRSSLLAPQPSQQSQNDEPEPGKSLRTKTEELDATLKRIIEKKEMNAKAEEERRQSLEAEKKNERSPLARKNNDASTSRTAPSKVQMPETKVDKKTKVSAKKDKSVADDETKKQAASSSKTDGVQGKSSNESQNAGTSGNKHQTPVKRKPRKKDPSDRALQMAMKYGFGNSMLATTQPRESKRQTKPKN